jgi:ankyrin repeat protein
LVPSSPSLPLQADLVIGAADLDIDKVARYLVLDCPPLPVNAPNHLGITPLMAAMRSPAARVRPKAHLEMVRFLVECCGADVDGVRVDRVTGLGESVLSVACGMGAVEVVRYLVGRGVGVDTRLPVGAGIGKAGHGVVLGRGQTALHVAVLADQAECVEVLVNQGKADVNAVFDAAGVEEGAVVEGGLKGLRRRTGSVSRNRSDKRPKHPVSALHLAHGSVPCTRVLLEFGANVCAKDGHGRTPLHWAATGGHADVVRMLIGAGADVNASSDDGVASLGAAITSVENGDEKEGHAEVLRALLQESLEAGNRYKGLELLTSTTVFSSTKEGSNVWEEKVQAAS